MERLCLQPGACGGAGARRAGRSPTSQRRSDQTARPGPSRPKCTSARRVFVLREWGTVGATPPSPRRQAGDSYVSVMQQQRV